MIIIHRPFDEKIHGQLKRRYQIFESDENILIKYDLIDVKCIGEVLLNKIKYKNTCIDLWSSFDSGLRVIPVIRKLLDQDPVDRTRLKATDCYKIGRIVFDQDEIYCHLQGRFVDIPGFTNYHIKDDDFSSNVLSSMSELFRQTVKQYKAKTELLHNVSMPISLSYLESQLDLITRVIVQNKDILQQTPELQMLTEYDQQSTLLIKENILDEVKNKLNVRQQQAKYYLNR